jgi:hypothetical protein
MAKSKKQSAGESESVAAPAAKKPAAKKPAKAKAPAAPAGMPLIDTSLAAEAAAKMVTRRDKLPNATPAEGEKRESAAFKQLKDSINKPTAQGPAGLLHSTTPNKNFNLPMGNRKQVGHNQTFGADVNRSGVPRRTGG